MEKRNSLTYSCQYNMVNSVDNCLIILNLATKC